MEETPPPSIEPGHVIVNVRAAGVNFPDVLIIEDRYQLKPPRPFSPGGEVSGVVQSVGEGVRQLRPGDRVLALTTFGGMAEQVLVQADRVTAIPDAMPFDEAAAFVMTYGAAYHALKDRARLAEGETVLVLGASGGVGVAAIELARHIGARVVAACSSEDKLAAARRAGADDGVVYGQGRLDVAAQRRLADAFKAACGPRGADVILDTVGGDYTEPALRAIAWEGRYLVVGFAAGEIPRPPLNLALLKACQIIGVFWGAWMARNPAAYAQEVGELLELYGRGLIRPLISAHFPLEHGAAAIALLASRRAKGKIVVTVD